MACLKVWFWIYYADGWIICVKIIDFRNTVCHHCWHIKHVITCTMRQINHHGDFCRQLKLNWNFFDILSIISDLFSYLHHQRKLKLKVFKPINYITIKPDFPTTYNLPSHDRVTVYCSYLNVSDHEESAPTAVLREAITFCFQNEVLSSKTSLYKLRMVIVIG